MKHFGKGERCQRPRRSKEEYEEYVLAYCRKYGRIDTSGKLAKESQGKLDELERLRYLVDPEGSCREDLTTDRESQLRERGGFRERMKKLREKRYLVDPESQCWREFHKWRS